MAGLVGILGDGRLEELEAMAARMAYRGSQLATSSPAPGVYLGEIQHRLPQRSGDFSLCLDVDGALYPRPPGELIDSELQSASERERLEEALRQRGAVALCDVQCQFALAWWDAASHTTTLACDRLGLKVIYYVELPGRIAFATEYKALLALPDCPAEVDRDVLQTYLLLFSCPSNRSLLKGVKPLTQGTVLQVRDGQVRVDRYWQARRRQPERSFRDSAQALRAALEKVITRQLAGYDHMGLMLSGGLDSVALLAVVRHLRPDFRLTTYTIGHSAADPDVVGARLAAAHFGSVHQELFYPLSDLPAQLPRMVWQTEDLSGREEALLQPAITAVAGHVEPAIMSGHGADALFGGMPRHRILWLRDRSPPPLRGALCELFVYSQFKRMPRSWLGRQLVALAYRGDVADPPSVLGATAVGADAGCKSLDAYLEAHYAPSSGFLHIEPELARAEIPMLMPFLDNSIIEFALGCPGSYHIGLQEQKRLLRAAVADLLPPAMLASRKTIQRFKHDRELADVIDGIAASLDLARSLADRKLVPVEYVESRRTRSAGGAISPERMHSLWGLICAELWMRQFVDRRGRPLEPADGRSC